VVCLNHVERRKARFTVEEHNKASIGHFTMDATTMQQIRQLEPRLQEDKQPNQVLMNKMDALGGDFSDMGGAVFQNRGGSTGEARRPARYHLHILTISFCADSRNGF
jgi:hypothetical protein